MFLPLFALRMSVFSKILPREGTMPRPPVNPCLEVNDTNNLEYEEFSCLYAQLEPTYFE